MLNAKIRSFLFIFLLFPLLLPSPIYALRVKSIDAAQSRLLLDDGQTVQLAGIEWTPETSLILSVIFSQNDIEIEKDTTVPGDSLVAHVYIWVDASQMDVPSKSNAAAKKTKLLANELLLTLGTAKVKTADTFTKKDSFLKIEEAARRSGRGIWSIESPVIKKTS